MATITIRTQILDGNLGDGWNNNYEAANALADYTEKIWLDDLSDVIAAGHDIVIDIDVERNTSGCSRELSVDVDMSESTEENLDEQFELMNNVKNMLTNEGRIWETFCSSDEAAEFFEEA